MAHEIATPTKCLVCGRSFYGPTLAAPATLNGRPNHVLLNYLQKLHRHLMEEHPDAYAIADVQGAELRGYVILCHFKSQDPAVNEQRDRYRWSIHQLMLQARAQNLDVRAEQIAQEFIGSKFSLITRAGADPETDDVSLAIKTNDGQAHIFGPYTLALLKPMLRELEEDLALKVEGVLRELSDILEEPGKYAPEAPAPASNMPSGALS